MKLFKFIKLIDLQILKIVWLIKIQLIEISTPLKKYIKVHLNFNLFIIIILINPKQTFILLLKEVVRASK